ncbi:MAG TPA: protein phosphatase 2C domain-containing protein [Longimicrobiales bacterium]|nr:protein phosphatase 2C domain-containing protein [Longimicrobiales bacterium]
MAKPVHGHRGPIVVSACGRTHRGRVRPENQDRLLVADLAEGILDAHTADEWGRGSSVGPLQFELSERGAILLVADGMGGRAGGARASTLAVTAVRRAMADGAPHGDGAAPDGFVTRLCEALESANRDILEESEREERLRGMGTTATLAGIQDGIVYLAQVGDSRAYIVRGGSLARLTRDQSLVQDMIDSGLLDEKDAHAVRKNVILQALGAGRAVEPAVTYHELRDGDVVLLCSDGLSHVVADEEILEAVAQSADCMTMCDRLVGLANDRGGPDNVTVLVARLEGGGLEPASGAQELASREWTSSRR